MEFDVKFFENEDAFSELLNKLKDCGLAGFYSIKLLKLEKLLASSRPHELVEYISHKGIERKIFKEYAKQSSIIIFEEEKEYNGAIKFKVKLPSFRFHKFFVPSLLGFVEAKVDQYIGLYHQQVEKKPDLLHVWFEFQQQKVC